MAVNEKIVIEILITFYLNFIIIQEGVFYLVNTLVDFFWNQEDFELAGGFLPVDSGLNPPADSKSTGKLKILLFLFPLPYYLVKSTYPILLCWNPTPHTSELLEKILPSALQNLPSACGLGQILEDLGQDFFQNSSDRGWISYQSHGS